MPTDVVALIFGYATQGTHARDTIKYFTINKAFKEILSKAPVSINVSWYEAKITDEVFGKLNVSFPCLISLTIDSTALTKAVLKRLQDLKYLTALTISSNALFSSPESDYPLSALHTFNVIGQGSKIIADDDLAALPNLTALTLANCRDITDNGFTQLQNLSNLTTLSLSSCNKMTNAGFAAFSTLPKLISLSVKGSPAMTDNGLALLHNLTALTALDLEGGKQLTSEGITHFLTLTNLTDLNLGGTKIMGSDLKYLQNFRNLCTLQLGGLIINDADLEQLQPLSKLTSLNLSRCDFIPDTGLQYLENLTLLNLSCNVKLRQTGLKYLKNPQNLTRLDLSWTDINDTVLKDLTLVTNLNWLSLAETEISALGLDDLKCLTKLKFLDLTGNYITTKELISLRKAIPKLVIQTGPSTKIRFNDGFMVLGY